MIKTVREEAEAAARSLDATYEAVMEVASVAVPDLVARIREDAKRAQENMAATTGVYEAQMGVAKGSEMKRGTTNADLIVAQLEREARWEVIRRRVYLALAVIATGALVWLAIAT